MVIFPPQLWPYFRSGGLYHAPFETLLSVLSALSSPPGPPNQIESDIGEFSQILPDPLGPGPR